MIYAGGQYCQFLITRYDGFPEKGNESYYLYSMIQGIVFAIAQQFISVSQFGKESFGNTKK